MDLKKAVDDIRGSPTLKKAIGSLLAIGNFLNGREVSTCTQFEFVYINYRHY